MTILPEIAMSVYGQEPHPEKYMKSTPPAVRDTIATIQHKYDRFHPARRKPKPNEIRLTLWCYKCNHEDGLARLKAQPIEELRKRSQRRG